MDERLMTGYAVAEATEAGADLMVQSLTDGDTTWVAVEHDTDEGRVTADWWRQNIGQIVVNVIDRPEGVTGEIWSPSAVTVLEAEAEGNLVCHAVRELELCGQTTEDPEFAASLVEAVRAFSSYGHSGGSAGVAVAMLGALLRFEPLSALTVDEAEWTDVAEQSGVPLWQSKRNPAAFCEGVSPEAEDARFYRLGDGAGRIALTPVGGHLVDGATS